MEKIFTFLLLFALAIPSLKASNDEGRPIRSNWFCMDAALGCAGVYGRGSDTEGLLSFSATIRFRPNQYNSFPDPYIQLEAGNTSVVLPIDPNAIADTNNHFTAVIGYDQNGVEIKDLVTDITFFFTAYIPNEDTEFEYYIGLVDFGKQPYPVWNYDRLTAPFNPEANWSSYAINDRDQLIESMVKPICASTPCSAPPTRMIATEVLDVAPQPLEMSATPNPFNDQLNINYQLTESSEQVVVEVMDVTGKTVYQETVGNLPQGHHQLSLDAANWAQGIYICKVLANKERNTIKIVKQ